MVAEPPQIYEDATGLSTVMAAGTESLDAELLQDLRGLGKPPSFDGKRCTIPRLSIQLQNTHQPRQFSLSRADGQMRSRAESDSLAAVKVLGDAHLKCCRNVLLVRFNHERKCANSCPIC